MRLMPIPRQQSCHLDGECEEEAGSTMPLPRQYHLDMQKFIFNIFSPIAFRKPFSTKKKKKSKTLESVVDLFIPDYCYYCIKVAFCFNPLNVNVYSLIFFPSAEVLMYIHCA